MIKKKGFLIFKSVTQLVTLATMYLALNSDFFYDNIPRIALLICAFYEVLYILLRKKTRKKLDYVFLSKN